VNIRQEIEKELREVLSRVYPSLDELHFEVSKPREKSFGDFATNLAMVASKSIGEKPLDIAEKIVGAMEVPSGLIESVDVAKPGFINMRICPDAYIEKLREIATWDCDENCAAFTIGQNKPVQVEYVSANPTGPLNVVSARAAAVGDSLVRLLKRIGFEARSEFYVNDQGRQVELLGLSLEARFRQLMGQQADIPEGGYPGQHLVEVAEKIKEFADWANRMAQSEMLFDEEIPVSELDDCILRFLVNEAASKGPTDENDKLWLEEHISYRAEFDAELRPFWAPVYVCDLSVKGLTYDEIKCKLSLIERFREFALSCPLERIVKKSGQGAPAEQVFLGEAVANKAFDFEGFAIEEIVTGQKATLDKFGSRPEGGPKFDDWVRESDLCDVIDEVYKLLMADERFVTEKDGAVWLKGGSEEDSEEWVIRRSNGQFTYFLSDIAYHIYKKQRGFQGVIDIWGPDHHGHIARMKAAMGIMSEVIPDLEIDEDWLNILIVQQVNLLKEGKRVVMSKRAGEYVTLDDVVEEVGPDAARFFFLMRRCNSHLDFDVDLAKKASEENPVFYVQYAHARITSMINFARESGYDIIPPPEADLTLLDKEEEWDLIKGLADFDETVFWSAINLEPHRLTTYVMDLAGRFHRFYHHHRVITDDCQMSEARLFLVWATRTVLRGALSLLGISAPESM
jgi:arginyl-tRNA synthetase